MSSLFKWTIEDVTATPPAPSKAQEFYVDDWRLPRLTQKPQSLCKGNPPAGWIPMCLTIRDQDGRIKLGTVPQPLAGF